MKPEKNSIDDFNLFHLSVEYVAQHPTTEAYMALDDLEMVMDNCQFNEGGADYNDKLVLRYMPSDDSEEDYSQQEVEAQYPKLLALLRQIAPDIDIEEINGQLVIDRASLEQHLYAHADEYTKSEMARYDRKVKIARLMEQHRGESKAAYEVAMALAGDAIDAGTYFSIDALRSIHALGYETHQEFPLSGTHAYHILASQPDLVEHLIEQLDRMGVRRISFIGAGSSSIAFKTTEDENGQQQVLVISPEQVRHSGHPLVLPAKEEHLVKPDRQDRTGVRLRITPHVELLPHTDSRLLHKILPAMKRLLKKSGISGDLHPFTKEEDLDLKPSNIGMYSFVGEDGRKRKLPMILDWGMAHPKLGRWDKLSFVPNFLKRTPENLLKKWQSMKAFAPYWEAHRHIEQQGLENTISREAVEERKADVAENEPGEKSATMELADRGFYPDEIRELMSSTYAQGGAADFRKRLLAQADKVDHSGYIAK
ncbi:MAG: hypothetical protein SFT92_02105 [Rickettsiales bacterium]|nr:hypothetical protein [Rickettsiales bacterium]